MIKEAEKVAGKVERTVKHYMENDKDLKWVFILIIGMFMIIEIVLHPFMIVGFFIGAITMYVFMRSGRIFGGRN